LKGGFEMLRKIIRNIAVFVFYTGLVIYVLVYYLFDFLVDCFKGTKIARLIFLTQKGLEKCTENTTVKIIRKLEKRGMWY
jgi:hypothetical protein